MKNLLFIFLMLCFSCQGGSHEQQYASAFFQSRGMDVSHWEVVETREGFQVLTSYEEKKFILLADSAYRKPLQGNLVLAYGSDAVWSTDTAVTKILGYYEKMLQQLDAPNERKERKYEPLLKTRWGQHAPYNELCPELAPGQHAMAGCVPVALGQLVAFHHPEKGSSPAKLIAEIGASVKAHYGLKNTVASTHQMKPALVGSYGMAQACRLRVGLTNSQLLELAERNLKEGHPLLFSNRDHAFLCDGMEGDFLHLNLGLGGICDGYYRILYSKKWEEPFATSVLTDIYPSEGDLRLTIRVNQPGTLADKLGEDSRKVTHLTLSGTLNGKDVAFLRRLAGAVERDSTEPTGQLSALQLSGVRYVNGDVFAEEDAGASKFIVRRGKETFDFSNMSSSRWNYFRSKGYDKTADYRIIRKDGKYVVQFLLSPSPKSQYLFMGCENLK